MTPHDGEQSRPHVETQPTSASRRRLLKGGAAVTPAILTLISTPVRATYYTTPASSFASINTSRPRSTHGTSGCKPSWWVSCSMSSWPASCKTSTGTPKKFKDCFSTHATYGEKTLKECMQLSSDSGTDGLVKHLCAAYLNHASGKTPGEICSTQTAQSIWSSHNSKGYWEPTAGVRWYADSCTPTGNGGCTPWLKTTMPY